MTVTISDVLIAILLYVIILDSNRKNIGYKGYEPSLLAFFAASSIILTHRRSQETIADWIVIFVPCRIALMIK